MSNRILKESICTSATIDALTAVQEIFFYRLIVNCDDYGRMDARPRILWARLFPLRDYDEEFVRQALAVLARANLITLYHVGGSPFLQMTTWDKHQQVRARRSKYPEPEERENDPPDGEDPGRAAPVKESECETPKSVPAEPHPVENTESGAPENPSPEKSPTPSAGSRQPDKRSHGPREIFVPPTVDEVRAYCLERRNRVSADGFVDFYTSKGWKVGAQPMKDWKAAVRTWEQREGRTGPSVGKPVPAQQYEQRSYANAQETLEEMMARLEANLGPPI